MTTGAALANSGMCAAARGGLITNGHQVQERLKKAAAAHEFKMPLHYPRYSKGDYEKMPEWQLDRLLADYGLPLAGDVDHKRKFAIGAFLWPDQYS